MKERGLGDESIMKAKTDLIKGLEAELHRIQRWIDKEANPANKAKIISEYRKLSKILTTKEL